MTALLIAMLSITMLATGWVANYIGMQASKLSATGNTVEVTDEDCDRFVYVFPGGFGSSVEAQKYEECLQRKKQGLVDRFLPKGVTAPLSAVGDAMAGVGQLLTFSVTGMPEYVNALLLTPMIIMVGYILLRILRGGG